MHLSAAEYAALIGLFATDSAQLSATLDRLIDDAPPLSDSDLHAIKRAVATGTAAGVERGGSSAEGVEGGGRDEGVEGGTAEGCAAEEGGATGGSEGGAGGGVPSLWRADLTTVDAAGVCGVSGAQLCAVDASESERAALCGVIPRLVGGRKEADFASFTRWVESEIASGGPFEYVLDGANIGFYGQGRDAKGKAGGEKEIYFCHDQVDALYRAVAAQSPRVLIVLHVNHINDSKLSPSAAAAVARWREAGVLLTSPAGHNDDWYWLYTAMSSGADCKVVSNDEMRDHHFGMLAPASFLKWKERHVVHFKFVRQGGVRKPEPTMPPPPPYSHRIQRGEGGVCHLPSTESASWLCLRPPAGEATPGGEGSSA